MPGDNAFLDFHEARKRAQSFLPKALFQYIDRGTESETAISYLHEKFDRRRVIPQVLRPVLSPDTTTSYFGASCKSPFIIAPTALAGLVRYNGEVIMARAAQQAGIPFVVATQSSTSVEKIREGAPDADLWFQLYVWKDRTETYKLLDRVLACGIKTLVLTVDTPSSPKKVHNIRNGFSVPLQPSFKLLSDLIKHPRWLFSVMGRYAVSSGLPSYANYPGDVTRDITKSVRDPRFELDMVLDTDFVKKLRDRWPHRLVIKGIMALEDAAAAFELGADGVVISAHGGRNIDSAVAPLDVLEKIRAFAGAKKTIFADSGVRRGSDIAKLLAVGADAVFLGRAPLYGLAADSQRGVATMLRQLSDELTSFMAFSGAPDLNALKNLNWLESKCINNGKYAYVQV